MKFGEKRKLGNGSNESKVFFENGTGIRRQHWDRKWIIFVQTRRWAAEFWMCQVRRQCRWQYLAVTTHEIVNFQACELHKTADHYSRIRQVVRIGGKPVI